MKKILGLLAIGFMIFSCANEVETSDPGLQALTNNEEYQGAFKYENWRPDFIYATLANEKILQLRGETDTTRFTMRVPYFVDQQEDNVIILGPVVSEKVNESGLIDSKDLKPSNDDAAYGIYTLRDKFDRSVIGRYTTDSSDGTNNYGRVIIYSAAKQTPGTISGEFHVNLDLDPTSLGPNATEKQKERFQKLAKKKEFTKGYFFKVPLVAAE
ncbi:hypothetical protein ACYSNM_00725 [Myroides sp. LJL116]